MAKHCYPRKGDRVIDTYLTDKRREGVVQKIIYVQDEDYVEIKWKDVPYGALNEQVEYSQYFTQTNGGAGRWDAEQDAWLIEKPDGEELLPPDDPFVLSLNKGFEAMNKQLLIDRLGADSKLPSYQLLLKSCELRREADDMGPHSSYFNWYFFRAEDYARMAAYNQE